MTQRDTWERRFHEGLCSAASGKHEAAHAAFVECVVGDPGDGRFVHEFLENLKRLPATQPADDAQSLLAQAAAKQNWAEVLRQGPPCLVAHREHVPMLLMLADACRAQSFADSEAHYLRAALHAAGDDNEIQRRAGAALARLKLLDEAIACWRQVEAHDPTDEEPPRMIALHTIARSRRRAGFRADEKNGNGAGGPRIQRRREPVTRFVISNLDALLQSITHASGLSFTPIQQLEAAIRERPSVPDLYLCLAQLYLDKERDYDAERLLAKGRETTDRDARIQQMWEEVTMLRHARRIEIARQEIKVDDSPQTRDALAQAVKERDRVELDIFRSRVKREPEAAAHHYELGLRLLRADKPHEARPHFEKALADDLERGRAALALARCCQQLGDIPKTLAQYRVAAEAASASGQYETQNDALSEAGKLAQRIKLNRLAQRYLARLSVVSGQ
jgi:tetratricopeptide (TPR) repeat protein